MDISSLHCQILPFMCPDYRLSVGITIEREESFFFFLCAFVRVLKVGLKIPAWLMMKNRDKTDRIINIIVLKHVLNPTK